MSLSAIDTTRKTFTTDGVVSAFSYNIPFNLKSDIKVVKTTTATGAKSTLVLDSDYTVSATNNDFSSGGTITTTSVLASGFQLIVTRVEPLSQGETLREGQKLPSKAIEDALNKLTRITQQLQTDMQRTVRVADGDTLPNELADAVSSAGLYIYRDASGQFTFGLPDPSLISAENSIQLSSSVLSLINDEASPGALKTYKTDANGTRGWLADPTGSAQDALNGTRLSAQASFAAAVTDAISNTRPIIVDQTTDIDQPTTFSITGSTSDASSTVDIASLSTTHEGMAIKNINAVVNPNAAAVTEPLGADVGVTEIAITSHPFTDGQLVAISGTTGYNHIYRVLEESTGQNYIRIQEWRLFVDKAAAVDAGSGNVNIAIADHGWVSGQSVVIRGTLNYDGAYTLQAGTTTAAIQIVATYVAETFTGKEEVTHRNVGETLTGADTITLQNSVNIFRPVGAVVDQNAAYGMVKIPVDKHPYRKGEWVSIRGAHANYNGEFKVEHTTRGDGGFDRVWITATYASYTFTGQEQICLCGTQAIDMASQQLLNISGVLTSHDSGNKTGIPCDKHSFANGATVVIANSGVAGLDGSYTTQSEGSQDKIVINKAFGIGGTVTGGTARSNNLFGIPVYSHGASKWAKVTIAGTTNYDGTYTAHYLSDSSFDGYHVLIFPGTYVAESFTAGTVHENRVEFTKSSHGFVAGDQVTIAGDTNGTSFNGAYTVLAVSGNDVTIDAFFGASSFTAGATIQQDKVTITTSSAHGFSVNNTIFIRGSSNFDGKHNVEAVPSTTTFTIPSALSETFGGSVTCGNSIVNIPTSSSDDLTIIFPDNQFQLNFKEYLNVNFNCKIIADPGNHIFSMNDETLSFVNRTRVNMNSGLQSYPTQWGANREGSTTDANMLATFYAIRNAWNTSFHSGEPINFLAGIYIANGTLEEYQLGNNGNIEGLGATSLTGAGLRISVWKAAPYQNTPILLCHSNNWHNFTIEKMAFEGNWTYNQNLPIHEAIVVLEGYNVLIRECTTRNSSGHGMRFAGGQSNTVNWTHFESELNQFDGLIVQGVNQYSITGCSFEASNRYGLVLNPGPLNTYTNPDGAKCTITDTYFEANDCYDVVMYGVKNVDYGMNSRSALSINATILLSKHPSLDIPCRDIIIDASRTPVIEVIVDAECGQGVVAYYPSFPATDDFILTSADPRVMRTRRGKNPDLARVINGRLGTNYLSWSHPCYSGGSSVVEPYGDNVARWDGGEGLSECAAYIKNNTTVNNINQATRYENTTHNRTLQLPDTTVTAGTYYYRFLWNCGPDWRIQFNLQDTAGTGSPFYDWDHRLWSDVASAAVPFTVHSFIAYGKSEFVISPPIVCNIGRTIRPKLKFLDGDSQVMTVSYWDLVKDPNEGIIHKRNSSVVGYGMDCAEWNPEYYTDSGSPHTISTITKEVMVDSSSGVVTITLPASPRDGQRVTVTDLGGAANTNNITVGRNGNTINGAAADTTINTNYDTVTFIYGLTNDDWVSHL